MDSSPSFLVRNEFLIRRLHSLSGLIPVGAYMVVHLIVNASILESEATFQKNVHQIHSLGSLLPVVEWGFIFLPLIFHAVFGFVIIRGGLPNQNSYPYGANFRYSLQRASGMIAMVFIFFHVFHLHGWFHTEGWLETAKNLNGANFRPFNAASSLHLALRGFAMPALYMIGVAACVFHLANGIWTMGITWGAWVSPAAQKRAGWVCLLFGLALMVFSCSAMVGVKKVDLERALEVENNAVEVRLKTGEISEEAAEHKRFDTEELEKAEEAARKQKEAVDDNGDDAIAEATE